MSTGLVIGQAGTADNGAHAVPETAGPNWQETWWVSWHDAERSLGGFHHFGIQHGRGQADVWDWVAVDGEIVAFQQRLDLAPPTGEFPDYDIGPLDIRTKKALTEYLVTSRHPDLAVELRYEAFRDPVTLGLGGSDIFARHYESMGRAEGTLTRGDSTVDFTGVAFQDHSWGPRNHGNMVSHRWFWAVFEPDLYITAYGGYNEHGTRRVFGYLYERGEYHVITEGSFNYRIRDDGFTPAGAAMVLTTADGRAHHIAAEADCGQPISHYEGFLMTDALARFEYNGMRGVGLIECREVGSPAPWQTELHLPSGGARG